MTALPAAGADPAVVKFDGPFFTLVFDGSISALSQNPFETASPFGRVIGACKGDLSEGLEAFEDMLAALIEAEAAMTHHNAHRKHQSYQCDFDFAEGFGGTLDNVRAAIAKATGAA